MERNDGAILPDTRFPPFVLVRAAAIMSLLATAKANGRDPHAWLTDVLTRLPTTKDRDIEALLPHRWQPAD